MAVPYSRTVTFTSPSSRVRAVAAVRAAKILHIPAPKAPKPPRATPMLHVRYVHTHYVRAFSTHFRAH